MPEPQCGGEALIWWRVPEPEQNEEDLHEQSAGQGGEGVHMVGGMGAEMGTFYVWVYCSGSYMN